MKKEYFFLNQSVLMFVVPVAVVAYLSYGRVYPGFWIGVGTIFTGALVSALSFGQGAYKLAYRTFVLCMFSWFGFSAMLGHMMPRPDSGVVVQALAVMTVVGGMAIVDAYRVGEAIVRTTATTTQLVVFYGAMPCLGLLAFLSYIAGAQLWYTLALLALFAAWQAGFSAYLEHVCVPSAEVSVLRGGKASAAS